MPPTKAKSSKGIQLQRGDGGGSEVFTTIAEVTNITGPTENAGELDATSFDSTGMEFIGGLPDAGEVTFEVNFVGSNAQQQGLRTDSRAGTLRNFKLVLPDHATDPTTVAFSALVTKPPELSAAVNGVIKGSCTLKISGLPTWTYAPA
ncbi:MAG TPA: phage tail tube protein [Archangium sp.]